MFQWAVKLTSVAFAAVLLLSPSISMAQSSDNSGSSGSTDSSNSAMQQLQQMNQNSQQATQDVTPEDAHADAGATPDGNPVSPENNTNQDADPHR